MRRSELLRHVLKSCYCRLQPSRIHGIGVFAVRDIPSKVNPFSVMKRYARPACVRLTEEDLRALPPKMEEMIRAFFVATDGAMLMPTSGTNIVYLQAYLNHSEAPNLRTKDGFSFFTKCRIREGEELTVDYRTYDADVPWSDAVEATKRPMG